MDHLLCRCGWWHMTFLLGSSWSSPSSRLGLGPRPVPGAAAAHVGTHPPGTRLCMLLHWSASVLVFALSSGSNSPTSPSSLSLSDDSISSPPSSSFNVSTSKLRLMFSSIFFNFLTIRSAIMQSARRTELKVIQLVLLKSAEGFFFFFFY